MRILFQDILKFGYGINYKYEGMLAHSFDKFYVVTKLILPNAEDFKFSTFNFDKNCEYLKDKNEKQTAETRQHVTDFITHCKKIGPHIFFYKQQIKSVTETEHHILRNEIDLTLSHMIIADHANIR